MPALGDPEGDQLARHCCFWLLRSRLGPPNHPRLGVLQQGCTAVIPGEASTYKSAPYAQQPRCCQGCQAPHIIRLQTAIVSAAEERTLATSASRAMRSRHCFWQGCPGNLKCTRAPHTLALR